MKLIRVPAVLGTVLLLGACVNLPNGPSVMSLPGTGKTSDQFRDDDWYCRNFANDKVGGTEPNEVSRSSTAKGAAIGAGFGLITGLAVGAGSGENQAYALQKRYDQYYIQCMYAKGHRVPVSGRLAPPPSYAPPPPPPRTAPPAPPPPPPPPPR
jgi:hypothetical protein